MIVHRMPQGSREWIAVRLGKATSSSCSDIITPKRFGYSSSAPKYMAKLLAEWYTGYPQDDWPGDGATNRGEELEPEARDQYAFLRDVEVEEVGFCEHDELLLGVSPDGLVGQDGGVELKCPMLHTHITYLLDPAKLVETYVVQVQVCLWVTGRKWWDLHSFHPTIDPVTVRVEPDPDFQKAFGEHIRNFDAELRAGRAKLLAMGLTPSPPLGTAEDFAQLDRTAA